MGMKKKTGNAAVTRASQPGPQSAAARRAAEAELRGLITRFAAPHQRLVGTARRWLRTRLPAAHEVVYEYRDCCVISVSPTAHGYEGVFTLRAAADGIRLYFNRGKDLQDPDRLLQGAGKQARWLQLDGASTLKRPEVARLVDEALARNPVPFERTGRGPVVIRSAPARKPPRRR